MSDTPMASDRRCSHGIQFFARCEQCELDQQAEWRPKETEFTVAACLRDQPTSKTIVERLRNPNELWPSGDPCYMRLRADAANEIERLGKLVSAISRDCNNTALERNALQQRVTKLERESADWKGAYERCVHDLVKALGNHAADLTAQQPSGWHPLPGLPETKEPYLAKQIAQAQQSIAETPAYALGVVQPFTHWSKDPLIPYGYCKCSSCEEARAHVALTTTDNTAQSE